MSLPSVACLTMEPRKRIGRHLLVLVSHRGVLSTLTSSVLLVMLAHDVRGLRPGLHSWVVKLLSLVAHEWLLVHYFLLGQLVSGNGSIGLVLVEHCGLRRPRHVL